MIVLTPTEVEIVAAALALDTALTDHPHRWWKPQSLWVGEVGFALRRLTRLVAQIRNKKEEMTT